MFALEQRSRRGWCRSTLLTARAAPAPRRQSEELRNAACRSIAKRLRLVPQRRRALPVPETQIPPPPPRERKPRIASAQAGRRAAQLGSETLARLLAQDVWGGLPRAGSAAPSTS